MLSRPSRRRYTLKRRLSAIIGLLALLPVCGTIVGVVALANSARHNAELDRAVRSTIHLERINGLLYAAAMESRGIYKAPDWDSAKQSAANLIQDLVKLGPEVPNWQQDASAAQQAYIDELGRRIDDFASVRSKVVRLAEQDGIAAARAFADTKANHESRRALNRDLEALAQSNQQEIEQARLNIAMGDRAIINSLTVLAAIAGLVLCGGFLLVRNSLLRPLLWLKARMLQLAAGDLAAASDRPPRAAEIADMAQAVETFRDDLVDRRRLNRETELLSALNEWLQSCNSLTELYEMVGAFLAKLLPTCSGNLFVYANSRDILEAAQAWNGGRAMPAMHPEDCWGLRRGRTYTYGEHEDEIDFPCVHLGQAEPDPYCCIPILAHGETIGLLHLRFAADASGDRGEREARIGEQRRLGVVCAEQISLAIANVKLRDQLRDQSIRDPLTGLFNRRYLLETCRREFARATRNGQSVSMLSIDVDHFKKFNDNHGHDAGDTVLRAVGGSLEASFRNEDVPCRFGGEEFVVMMPGAGIETAAQRAEELRQRIEALTVRYLEQNLPKITLSIGVAAFPAHGDTAEGVLKVADDALYRAKAQGRNRVETSGCDKGTKDKGTKIVQPAPPTLVLRTVDD